MSVLYPSKSETLTAKNIVDAYRSAYYSSIGEYPDGCEHLRGRWFLIDGIERDRGWVILEVERLRQEALAKAMESQQNQETNSRSRIFKLIRRLSRL